MPWSFDAGLTLDSKIASAEVQRRWTISSSVRATHRNPAVSERVYPPSMDRRPSRSDTDDPIPLGQEGQIGRSLPKCTIGDRGERSVSVNRNKAAFHVESAGIAWSSTIAPFDGIAYAPSSSAHSGPRRGEDLKHTASIML